MIPSLIGNPRSFHLADNWQPQKNHSDRDEPNASPARDAVGNRE